MHVESDGSGQGDVETRTRSAYDRIAEDFAARTAVMPAEVIEAARQLLAYIGTGVRLLDVGCGPGRDMAWFEAQGARMVGVDLSGSMLALAQQAVRGHLAQMDMRHLALTDKQFDGVWCSASMLHLPKATAPLALLEFRRVLQPGGYLHLAIQEGKGEQWETWPYDDIERLFTRYSQQEAESMIRAAGFDILRQGRNDAGPRRWLWFLARTGV